MSDFSVGYFTRDENKEKVYPYLTEGELLIQYNDEWVGKLSALDWEKPQPQTLALSKEMPLLYVMHAEDHGFSMKILHEEEIKFHFDVSYEVGIELYTETGIDLYGNNWWEDTNKREERHQHIRAEWAEQLEQRGLLDHFFSNINAESLKAFQVFGISESCLLELSEILTIKNCATDGHQMIYALLDCLGLTQFSFVSYNYVSDGADDRFKVLNV